jgi:hypothetical protein
MMEFHVYRGSRLIDTFNCRESATAFIMREYSEAEVDELDIYVIEVELPDYQM